MGHYTRSIRGGSKENDQKRTVEAYIVPCQLVIFFQILLKAHLTIDPLQN